VSKGIKLCGLCFLCCFARNCIPKLRDDATEDDKKDKAGLIKNIIMKRIALCCLMLLLLANAYSQDLSFSQFYEKPLLRNPALAGVFEGDIRVSGVHRSQWQSVTVPFQTSALSFELNLPFNEWNDYLTVGVQATHDVAGDIKMKRTQLLPVVNYHKSLSGNKDDFLSVAFMAGPVNSQFDPTLLKMGDQFQNGAFNPNAPTAQVFSRTGFTYWDAATGLTFNSGFGEDNRYYIGAALFHFNKPKVAFYAANGSSTILPSKFVLNAGVNLATSDIHRAIVFADYFTQGGHRQFLGGAMYQMQLASNYDNDDVMNLSLGGFYRWKDAFIPVVKMDIYKLSIGLSYDINTSQLTTASNWKGGFELTASYKAKLSNRSLEADKVRCHF
jgi:type IX secretion system PorP/SprF family membrane protein